MEIGVVVAALGIEDVRQARRKCERVRQRIGLPGVGHRVLNLVAAAVIAGRADQKQDAQTIVGFLLEKIYWECDGPENRRAAIPGFYLR
jgi:hypothetical protein